MTTYVVTLTLVIKAEDEEKALIEFDDRIKNGDYDSGNVEIEEDGFTKYIERNT